MEKFDEATQACIILLDLKTKNSGKGVPELEEKCIRAIVGGTVRVYREAVERSDPIALDSARRSLSRVHQLLDQIRSSSNEAWVFETTAYFHEQIGDDKAMIENLNQEYRSLTSVRAWEKDDHLIKRVCAVVSQIVHHYQKDDSLRSRSKFLLSGVIKRVQQARGDKTPEEISALQGLLETI